MPPLSQPVHTHTQALVIKKPAGGSNSAKARLPKFVVTHLSQKKERDRERLKARPPFKPRACPAQADHVCCDAFISLNLWIPPRKRSSCSPHGLVLREPLHWCFVWVFVHIWGLHASSVCNWVSFPPTELALALIYLRVQISPCLLLKASTSSQNLFLLLETVPPHPRDTHSTRAMRRGDLLLTVWAAVAVPTMEVTEKITGTNSTPPLDSPDLRRTKGKAPLSSACGSLKDGRHDNIITY